MIRWMIISTLATGLFYALYLGLFRRDRWFELSRAYLFIIIGFCSLFPWFRLPAGVMSSTPATEFLMTVDNPEPYVVGSVPMEEPELSLKLDIIPMIYLGGVALMMAILIIQLTAQAVRIRRLRREYPVYGRGNGFAIPKGALLILVPDNTEPYSFFKNIIVGTRDLDEEEMRCILAHESVHVNRNHSLDIVCMRLICCVMWFNPFAWMMLHELRAVHEYQADAAAADIDNKNYLRLLYRQTTGFGYGHITNKFHSINIKKRIVMMNQKKTRFGAWKVLAALPVAVLLLMVGCQNAPLASDTLDTPKYNVPDGSYLVSDGNNVSYVDVFKDGHLVSRHLNGMVEIPLDKIGEMDILYDTSSFAIVDKAAEKHKEYKYVRVTRLKDMAESPDEVTDYYELCYSNDSTCQVAREIDGESVSTLPVYRGGEEAMYKYISENLRYPEQAKSDGIAGKVHVSFVVETDGSVSDVKVLRGIGHGCDDEAVRVVKSMPRWTPATLFGKPVRVHYTIPFAFRLQ